MDELDKPQSAGEDRREFLSKYGKLALVAPPVITMLLSTSMASPAIASSTGGTPERPKGNNGVGNGLDGQPPGNPKVNDGPGTGPGSPGDKGYKADKSAKGDKGKGHDK